MVISNLATLAYAKGFTHWLYKTSLPLSLVTLPGHCDNAAGMFATGDLLTISAADGTAIRAVTVQPEIRDVVTVDSPWGKVRKSCIVQVGEVRLEALR